jgi:cobalt-zinc-cadmium efflux system protein
MSTHVHRYDERGEADRRALAIATALIVGFMVAEVVFALVADSLALLADAAHMLMDAGALGFALFAARMAGRPARGRWTFGFRRLEILAAEVNGVTLLLVAAGIVYTAVLRLVSPPDVRGGIVLTVAVAGVAVNLAATRILAGSSRSSLNVRGAFLHVATDLAAFVGTAVAGLLILLTGWDRFDPLASLGVAALMLWAAFGLLRDSTRILLERAPSDLDPEAVGGEMLATDGVVEVHDLHVWTVTSGFPALSAHVLVEPGADCHALRRRLEEVLVDRFGLTHTTLQVDHASTGAQPIELGAPYRREAPLRRR